MQSQIHSLLRFKGQFYPVCLFGYSSKGIPGLEIVGMGKWGKVLKEKIIFLSKQRQLKIPGHRFVLCYEGGEFHQLKETHQWLELPLIILFWSLAGKIPIHKLEDCYCAGRVSAQGVISIAGAAYYQAAPLEDHFKLVSLPESTFHHCIDGKSLLSSISDLSWKTA